MRKSREIAQAEKRESESRAEAKVKLFLREYFLENLCLDQDSEMLKQDLEGGLPPQFQIENIIGFLREQSAPPEQLYRFVPGIYFDYLTLEKRYKSVASFFLEKAYIKAPGGAIFEPVLPISSNFDVHFKELPLFLIFIEVKIFQAMVDVGMNYDPQLLYLDMDWFDEGEDEIICQLLQREPIFIQSEVMLGRLRNINMWSSRPQLQKLIPNFRSQIDLKDPLIVFRRFLFFLEQFESGLLEQVHHKTLARLIEENSFFKVSIDTVKREVPRLLRAKKSALAKQSHRTLNPQIEM